MTWPGVWWKITPFGKWGLIFLRPGKRRSMGARQIVRQLCADRPLDRRRLAGGSFADRSLFEWPSGSASKYRPDDFFDSSTDHFHFQRHDLVAGRRDLNGNTARRRAV